jgi:hypothetical protein
MLLASLALAAPAWGYVNWPGYLFDPSHTSLNSAATAITPANAGTIVPVWSQPFAPSGGFDASPVVYNGFVYIGGNSGWFYQLDEATGNVVHKAYLGTEQACTEGPFASGVVDTATVAPDPSRGGAPTVYVTGGDGTNGTLTNGQDGIYLWAFDATTLARVWSADPVTVDHTPGDLGWASPTVANGTISVGIASDCDAPLVRGGVARFSQSGGAPAGTYWAVPSGSQGGTIWSTPAVSGSSMWVATGNGDPTPGAQQGDSFSIVRLDGAATTHSDIWTVPNQTGLDNDFGDSPTLFTGTVNGVATPMIGDCSKNGWFYALKSQNLSAGPVWKDQLSVQDDLLCSAGAIWDAGANQLIVGSTLTPNGNPGSIQALSPDTGQIIWQSYLPCAVEGAPSEDAAGVLAVVTFSTTDFPCSAGTTPSLYLFNAHATVPNSAGPPAPQLLATIPLGRAAFSQPAFADGNLFVGTEGSLMAYNVPAPAPPTGGGSPPPPPPPPPSGTHTVTAAEIIADLRRALLPVGRGARFGAILKHHGYTFMFTAPTAGKVVIEWSAVVRGAKAANAAKPVIVATGRARFSKPGRVRITIRLTATGGRMLKHARRLRLTAKGTYTPAGRPSVTATRTFTLRR